MKKIATLVAAISISALPLCAAAPLLQNLKTGQFYYALNHAPTPRNYPTEQEVQPPVDAPKGFDYSTQEIDWIGRHPRREEYARYNPDNYGPQFWTADGKKRKRPLINIRTLPDGTFQRYNPALGEYENVQSPNQAPQEPTE